jgi:hypothetical protein
VIGTESKCSKESELYDLGVPMLVYTVFGSATKPPELPAYSRGEHVSIPLLHSIRPMRCSRTTCTIPCSTSPLSLDDTPSSSLQSNPARGTLQYSVQYIPLGTSDAVHAIGSTENVLRKYSDVVPGGRLGSSVVRRWRRVP